jgi:hypothetical protein
LAFWVKALIFSVGIYYEGMIKGGTKYGHYSLYHYVSKPIIIEHNVGASYPNPLTVYITKVNNDQSIEVICTNSLGLMVSEKFTQTQITKYTCL